MRFRFSLLSVALFTAFVLGSPQVARAGELPTNVFTFTGNCADCIGTGTGTLTLTDYATGDALTLDNFVSFTYTSSIYTSPFTLTESDVSNFGGEIDAATGEYNVYFNNSDYSRQFYTSTGGFWCLGDECLADYGFSHSWNGTAAVDPPSPVPEPGTASLVALGLAGAGMVRRRFQR